MNNFFEIKNATFKAGGKDKIKNLSIEIKNEGDIVCLLGPSGIGKTTILRTIAGLEQLENGEIILKDKIISSTNEHLEPEKRKIALSFQENSLFPHHSIYKKQKFFSSTNCFCSTEWNSTNHFLTKLLSYRFIV